MVTIFWMTTIGSFSKDDVDGNENGKKALGLDWQNNNFARASRVFVHFLVLVARLRHDLPYFMRQLDGASKHNIKIFFSFL